MQTNTITVTELSELIENNPDTVIYVDMTPIVTMFADGSEESQMAIFSAQSELTEVWSVELVEETNSDNEIVKVALLNVVDFNTYAVAPDQTIEVTF